MLYVPEIFQNNNTAQLHRFMKRYNFCNVISHASSLQVSHLPLILLPDEGKLGTLVGHMAKANNQWKDFDGIQQVLCIFNGPHAYISPSWYQNKSEVPTWNYAVVHAEGAPQIVTDKEELARLVDEMVSYFELKLHDQQSIISISDKYKKSLLDYIVGFKIEISELTGKFKLGQNRSSDDQAQLIESLSQQKDDESKRLAEFILSFR